jgi:hypothetical protein
VVQKVREQVIPKCNLGPHDDRLRTSMTSSSSTYRPRIAKSLLQIEECTDPAEQVASGRPGQSAIAIGSDGVGMMSEQEELAAIVPAAFQSGHAPSQNGDRKSKACSVM